MSKYSLPAVVDCRRIPLHGGGLALQLIRDHLWHPASPGFNAGPGGESFDCEHRRNTAAKPHPAALPFELGAALARSTRVSL